MDDPSIDEIDLDALEQELAQDEEASEALHVDDSLSPMERWHRYITSPHELHRLFTVKMLTDAVRETDAATVQTELVPLIEQVANEEDSPVVRTALAEQLGLAAPALFKKGPKELTHTLVTTTFLNLVASLIVDDHEDVRKESETSLVAIAELLPVQDVGSSVLTIVLGLASSKDEEDHRISSLGLLASLATMLGPSLCRTFAVKQIQELSQDHAFKVRRACAEALTAVASVAPETRPDLLELFLNLARDPIWSVRKACADELAAFCSHMPVANRSEEMLGLCEELLEDENRWVKKSAGTKLGEFISVLPLGQVGEKIVGSFRDLASTIEARSNEMEIPCAFCLPGVAKQLGPERWSELNELYGTLRSSTQWQVRKTVSYSLHELSRILGPELTEALLVDAFFEFCADLPEVRLGVYQSIDVFVGLVPARARSQLIAVLPKMMADYKNMEHWRMRELLAQKLGPLCYLFQPEEVYQQLWPLLQVLWRDNVAEVRAACCAAPGAFMVQLEQHPEHPEWGTELTQTLLALGNSHTWIPRQTFCGICQQLVSTMDSKVFAETFLPRLLELAEDKVPNVRLAMLRALVAATESYQGLAKDEQLNRVLRMLAKDKDRDVSRIASDF